MKLLLLIPMLIFAGCATQQPTMQTRYVMDSSGNLAQQQYLVPASDTGNKLLETVAIVGLGIVGLYFVGEVFDVWDDDPAPAAAPSNPLVAAGGDRKSVV